MPAFNMNVRERENVFHAAYYFSRNEKKKINNITKSETHSDKCDILCFIFVDFISTLPQNWYTNDDFKSSNKFTSNQNCHTICFLR